MNESAQGCFEKCLFEAYEKSGWVLEATAREQKKSEGRKIWIAADLKR